MEIIALIKRFGILVNKYIVGIMFLLLPSLSYGEEPTNYWAILSPTDFGSLDMDASNFPAKGWLALVPINGFWNLIPTKVSLRIPENENGKVLSPAKGKALYFFHDPTLLAGQVKTPNMKFAKVSRELKTKLSFEFNDTTYTLSLNKRGEVFFGDHLSKTKISQMGSAPEASVSLNFAGDLNHDNIPDLILYEADEKSDSVCLYTSNTNPLLKQKFQNLGCQMFSG